MLLQQSCRHTPVGTHAGDPHYCQVDSQLRAIRDIDSLSMLVRSYHEEQDETGEMLACKYQGNRLRNQSRLDEAIKAHTRGLNLSSNLADTLEMISALNCIGTDYRRLGDLSEANGYHYRALKMSDTYSDHDSPEAVKCRVAALNGIGNIEIDMCNYTTADSVLREALEGERQLGSEVGMAINYANLGAIMMALGAVDSAWVYYRESMNHNRQANNELGLALCHHHFGRLYELERNYSHAQQEYQMAYDALKSLNEKWHWLESCLSLASVCIKLGEKDEACRYLAEADQETSRINSKESKAQVLRVHYELAVMEGDYRQALSYFKQSDELFDSIHGLEKNDMLHKQRNDYQIGIKNGEVTALNNDIARLKRMRNMVMIFSVLLFLMATAIIFTLVYAMRIRNRTQRMLSQIEETRSLFFTNVVHMLRTPLTAIMGAIDVIIAEDKGNGSTAAVYSPVQRKNMDIIERQGRNLLNLVDRILEVGSVRSEIKELDWRRGDASTFMRMVLESYRERCVARHIELTYASREDSVEIDTVPRYLSTIVGSLIENAINYCHDFCKITVTTHVEDGMFIIRVADDGMGISKADLPHVFEPFYRGASAEQMVEGVGIGLTVVRDMTMAMGGSVSADSMKDHGSVFTVKLPCKKTDMNVRDGFDKLLNPIRNAANRTVLKNAPDLKDESVSTNDLPLVLVVEDHVDVAHLVGTVLKNEYAVCYATDGEQGLAKAAELMPDLIITDVKMPLMDGCELCRQLRASSQLCHIPVIMLSARTATDDRINGIKAGADVYMIKPFVPEELRAWATHLINRNRLWRERDDNEKPVSPQLVAAETEEDANCSNEAFLQHFATLLGEHDALHKDKLNLDKLALEFKMGESQLKGKIRELTGKSITAYVNQLRMEKALHLLQENPDLLIGDIAAQCGFTDVAYFSKVFRRHFKMTPTGARKTVAKD